VVVKASDSEIAVAWSAPTDVGTSPISEYQIQYSSDSGSTWTNVTVSDPTKSEQTVSGLARETSYVFRILAKNSSGWSAASQTSAAVKRGTFPATYTLVSPKLNFIPQQGRTLSSIEGALVQAKIVAPPINAPIATVNYDLANTVADDQNRTLVESKLTIEAGTEAKISIKPTVTQGKVVAGFIRIAGTWTYLGIKDLNPDGTATFDGMAFTLPTQVGNEYVILLAVVDANYSLAASVQSPLNSYLPQSQKSYTAIPIS
jgi:hypothetical protein